MKQKVLYSYNKRKKLSSSSQQQPRVVFLRRQNVFSTTALSLFQLFEISGISLSKVGTVTRCGQLGAGFLVDGSTLCLRRQVQPRFYFWNLLLGAGNGAFISTKTYVRAAEGYRLITRYRGTELDFFYYLLSSGLITSPNFLGNNYGPGCFYRNALFIEIWCARIRVPNFIVDFSFTITNLLWLNQFTEFLIPASAISLKRRFNFYYPFFLIVGLANTPRNYALSWSNVLVWARAIIQFWDNFWFSEMGHTFFGIDPAPGLRELYTGGLVSRRTTNKFFTVALRDIKLAAVEIELEFDEYIELYDMYIDVEDSNVTIDKPPSTIASLTLSYARLLLKGLPGICLKSILSSISVRLHLDTTFLVKLWLHVGRDTVSGTKKDLKGYSNVPAFLAYYNYNNIVRPFTLFGYVSKELLALTNFKLGSLLQLLVFLSKFVAKRRYLVKILPRFWYLRYLFTIKVLLSRFLLNFYGIFEIFFYFSRYALIWSKFFWNFFSRLSEVCGVTRTLPLRGILSRCVLTILFLGLVLILSQVLINASLVLVLYVIVNYFFFRLILVLFRAPNVPRFLSYILELFNSKLNFWSEASINLHLRALNRLLGYSNFFTPVGVIFYFLLSAPRALTLRFFVWTKVMRGCLRYIVASVHAPSPLQSTHILKFYTRYFGSFLVFVVSRVMLSSKIVFARHLDLTNTPFLGVGFLKPVSVFWTYFSATLFGYGFFGWWAESNKSASPSSLKSLYFAKILQNAAVPYHALSVYGRSVGATLGLYFLELALVRGWARLTEYFKFLGSAFLGLEDSSYFGVDARYLVDILSESTLNRCFLIFKVPHFRAKENFWVEYFKLVSQQAYFLIGGRLTQHLYWGATLFIKFFVKLGFAVLLTWRAYFCRLGYRLVYLLIVLLLVTLIFYFSLSLFIVHGACFALGTVKLFLLYFFWSLVTKYRCSIK